jgi:predicted unusual protein kinase regulating ubiquinone biosynthesis (AarF/ABC1/UbiB family)
MSLLPKKYDKYVRFFTFVLKYWNSNIFISDANTLHEFEQLEATDLDPTPEELVEDLKAMGPTYVKLGQLLSTRPDMLPEPYLKALANLQDDGDEIPYKEVEQLFREEIGQRISKAFASFNQEPIASASIGQVHEATLHSGKKVAVKIQRPDVRKRFVEDLETLMTLSEKAEEYSKEARKFSIHNVIEELRYILLQELDYTREAQNLTLLKENMKEFGHLYIPAVIPGYYSQRVLTMEYVEGQKVTSISTMALMDMPRNELVDDLVKGYLKQIIVDGFAHADPHPGNVHITRDHKLALMDLGMVARFSDHMQESILKIMMALGNHDGDRLVSVLLEMSEYDEEKADITTFKKMVLRKVQENQNSRAEDLQTGQLILKTNQIAANNNITLPSELSILGKILLNMDQIVAFLAPEYNLEETVRNYIEELMRDRMLKQLKSGHVLQTLLESKELTENLPYRLNKISENLAENKFKIKVEAFDEHRFVVAFQKVANRITIGIVIAALILGAALLMRIPTNFTIIGYPGFAILLFLFAASIGLYLIYKILFTDEPENKDRR